MLQLTRRLTAPPSADRAPPEPRAPPAAARGGRCARGRCGAGPGAAPPRRRPLGPILQRVAYAIELEPAVAAQGDGPALAAHQRKSDRGRVRAALEQSRMARPQLLLAHRLRN